MSRKKTLKKIIEKIAIKIAIFDANATCPFITYQPIEPKSVKKLKKL